MSARDDAHEALIREAWHALIDAACRADRVAAAERMKSLVGERSPEQITRMEERMGLR
jgi:hypothetical protein